MLIVRVVCWWVDLSEIVGLCIVDCRDCLSLVTIVCRLSTVRSRASVADCRIAIVYCCSLLTCRVPVVGYWLLIIVGVRCRKKLWYSVPCSVSLLYFSNKFVEANKIRLYTTDHNTHSISKALLLYCFFSQKHLLLWILCFWVFFYQCKYSKLFIFRYSQKRNV